MKRDYAVAGINRACPNIEARPEGSKDFSLHIIKPVDVPTFTDQKRTVLFHVLSGGFRISRETEDRIFYAPK